MRISELSATTGVSLPTIKYYLREGLLFEGRARRRLRPSTAKTTCAGFVSSGR